MSERITRANLETRVENLNRRLKTTTTHFVAIEGRNGYVALDECMWEDGKVTPGNPRSLPRLVVLRNITVGTKREIADFLHAMMVGIDLSRVDVNK